MAQWRVGMLGLGLALGCGPGPTGPKALPVTGSVTWNGTPVPEGHVVFAAAHSKQLPVTAPIANGDFRLDLPAGTYRVEVYATRELVLPNSPMKLARQDYIPRCYNADSTLSAEVKPGDRNHFPYDLREPPG